MFWSVLHRERGFCGVIKHIKAGLLSTIETASFSVLSNEHVHQAGRLLNQTTMSEAVRTSATSERVLTVRAFPPLVVVEDPSSVEYRRQGCKEGSFD